VGGAYGLRGACMAFVGWEWEGLRARWCCAWCGAWLVMKEGGLPPD
jgi:hypothetical protein